MSDLPTNLAGNERSLTSWCDYVTRIKDENGQQVTRVALAFSNRREWKTARVASSIPVTDCDATELKARIDGELSGGDISGRYGWALAFFPRAKSPATRQLLELPESDDDDHVFGETPNEQSAAVVRQAIKFNAGIMARHDSLVGQVLTHFADQNARYRELELGMLNERIQHADRERELRLRDVEQKEKDQKNEVLANAFSNIAQAVAYKLTGGGVAPTAKEKIITQGLRKFGTTISDEQATALTQILSPDQLILLEGLTTDPEAFIREGKALLDQRSQEKTKEMLDLARRQTEGGSTPAADESSPGPGPDSPETPDASAS